MNLLRLVHVLQERLLVRCDCRTAVVGLWSEVCLVFNTQRCRCGFLPNFPIRCGCSEDLLAFTLICSSTLRVRLQNNSRQPWRSVFFMVQLLQSSCIPLAQYKSQSVGCKERLRAIVFDKIAILLCELKNCTSTLYFDEVSKYCCMVRCLAWPSRIEFLPCSDRRPSGSLQ